MSTSRDRAKGKARDKQCAEDTNEYSQIVDANKYSKKKKIDDKQRAENTHEYFKIVGASEGFHDGDWGMDEIDPPEGGIHRVSIHNDLACRSAEFAIDSLRQQEGKNLELKKIVRVTTQSVRGDLFYLTLEATDDQFYEAEVYAGIDWEKEDDYIFTLNFIRNAVHYPQVQYH
ncbi:Proteinase inhibitor I25, cystatin, conserved region [Parasponia andersonii]|uniref:Proteinase inhibitor I25, cystatin, conserved region n=1 Tax=Parasponia andersonii TaxID=3476 RepID=A0A2P5AJ36_PARAD|nr:Proteinase inhibitor I25, cystatin, conserved region [Parasponia andersonii]PON36548.1 Proteinase inhibitor I25, cystatin, conserved region [Parasponia andersonii]